jgi:hypothetical protein
MHNHQPENRNEASVPQQENPFRQLQGPNASLTEITKLTELVRSVMRFLAPRVDANQPALEDAVRGFKLDPNPRTFTRLEDSVMEIIATHHGWNQAQTKAAYARQRATNLDNQNWEPQSVQITLPHDDRFSDEYGSLARRFVDTAIPLNAHFAMQVPGAGQFFPYEFTGKSSRSLKLPSSVTGGRVANGWLSILRTSGGEAVFEGFRTGALIHYGEKDQKARTESSRSAGKELLAAIASFQLSKLPPEEVYEIFEGRGVLPLRIASFDLQTLGAPEGTSLSIESLIVNEGMELKRSLAGSSTIPLMFGGGTGSTVRPIKTQIELLSFNFPVHEQSHRQGFGWQTAETEPSKGRASLLLQQADELVASPATDAKLARKLQYLTESIRSQLENDSYQRASSEPYRLNAHLMNLAYQLGYSVHFHCRSGKDRTAMMDAEAKLVTGLISNHDGDSGGTPLPKHAQLFLRALLLSGASGPISKLNSGARGLKLKPMTATEEGDPFVDRLGYDAWQEARGFSRLFS